MLLPMSKWNLHCTNPQCGTYFEQHKMEPDAVCGRCGSLVEVSEKITFKETEEKDINDLRGN